MPPIPMPLTTGDYAAMNCTRAQFDAAVEALERSTRYHVINATHRLAEAEWIRTSLEDQVLSKGPPIAQEGLLSLQLYLLVTCADTLGHVHTENGPKARIETFFRLQPSQAKARLLHAILVWETAIDDLADRGLYDASNGKITYPSGDELVSTVESLTKPQRLNALVQFLYQRRNLYTHESQYPQAGYHPNLSVLQNQRLSVPNTASIGDRDRLQVITSGPRVLFAFFQAQDPIAELRLSITEGLGAIVGVS